MRDLLRKAFDEKLTKGGNLLDFQKLIWTKMEEHGLETIAYLPDPSVDASAVTDTTKVYSIITHHSCFTMDKASEAAKAQSAKCNKCDQANSIDAKNLLHKSIDMDIQDELNLVKEEKTTFIEHWMEVMSIIQAQTPVAPTHPTPTIPHIPLGGHNCPPQFAILPPER